MDAIAIGVDVGGSHVSCAACNLSEKTYLPKTHSELPLDNQWPAEDIIRTWAQAIRETMHKAGDHSVNGIGFAMPGPFDYVKGVAMFRGNNKKYEGLYGLNVTESLQQALELPADYPIRYINDATAFALAEAWIGQARGTRRSLSITLGTGFGSAFLSEGLPVVSGDTVPEMGCVWHLPFENGNADDYFSTRGFLNRYHERTGKTLAGVKDLANLAAIDALAMSLFDDFGSKLGGFLGPWIKKSGAEALVIGGNISHAFDLFGPSLHKSLSDQGIHIHVAVSELKESAAMIGSALLVDNDFYGKVLPLLAFM